MMAFKRVKMKSKRNIDWWARIGILLWFISAFIAVSCIWWLIDFVVKNLRGLL